MNNLNLSLISNFFIAILAIINPVGNIPVFIDQVRNDSKIVQKDIAMLLSLIIFVIMLIFFLTGESLLKIFGITIPAFRIAGGILILLIGLRTINGRKNFDTNDFVAEPEEKSTFKQAKKRVASLVVPLAIPIFVGPGVATTVILYSQQISGITNTIAAVIAMFLVSSIVASFLLISNWFSRIFGKNFMDIISRTMGLILCAIAIQFMIEGINQLFPGVINPEFTHEIVKSN